MMAVVCVLIALAIASLALASYWLGKGEGVLEALDIVRRRGS